MKKSLIIFCLIIFSGFQTELFSQSISPFKIDRNKKDSVIEFRQKTNVKLYQVLNTDLEIVKNLYQSSPDNLELEIPIDDRRLLTIELKKVNIFTSNFQLITASNNSEAKFERGVFYKGKVKDDEESLVSISIFSDEMSGFISTKNENYSLGKLKKGNWENEHLIYDDSFLFQDKELECGTKDDGQGYNGRDLEITNDEALADKCVKLYFEVDYDIFSHFGNLSSTTN